MVKKSGKKKEAIIMVNKATSYTHSYKKGGGGMMMHSKFKRPQQLFATPLLDSKEKCCGLPKCYKIDLAV